MAGKVFVKKKLVSHTKSGHIISLFFEEFEDTFTSDEQEWDKVKIIFSWLKEEARNARYFSDINAIDKCRRISESYFSKKEGIKRQVIRESRKVNRELRKRFDELRTTRKSRRGKFLSLLESEHEHEKALPPK